MEVLVWGQQASFEKAAAAGYSVAAGKQELFERSDVLSLHVRLTRAARDRRPGRSRPHEADRADRQHVARRAHPARRLARRAAQRPARLCRGRRLRAGADRRRQASVAVDAERAVRRIWSWAEWPNFRVYFREAFEQIVAYERGQPLRLANPDVGLAHAQLNVDATQFALHDID